MGINMWLALFASRIRQNASRFVRDVATNSSPIYLRDHINHQPKYINKKILTMNTVHLIQLKLMLHAALSYSEDGRHDGLQYTT